MTNDMWPRGSEWRKWDLHVHSPASYGFSGDYNQFVIQLGNADCDVIGINDYFSVAGYSEVLRRLSDPGAAAEGNRAYRDALEKLKGKTLLPVVECRMTNVLVNKKGNGQRINFHLIFDSEIGVENIETFLKAQRINDSSIGSRYSDSQFLLEHVSVDFNNVRHALQSDLTFRGRYLIWLPYDEYGGIDGINPSTDKMFKEHLIASADILGSANKKQSDFFLWRDAAFTEEQYRSWFGRRKPCIKGSDSHNVNEEIGKLKDHNSQPTDKYCWIKADPTFTGLKQIINEPEDRVYIGAMPPKLQEVRANRTRFIDRLFIKKASNADTTDVWFDCDLPLNCDMVAIIGNKGSGKSALADILALAGNTHCDPEHFSFLNKQRFCERNGKLAKQFEVRCVWADGNESLLALNAKPNVNGVEQVRYIPQSYLEKVCTETDPSQQSEFQIELRKVIFSHISDADRLGQETLDDLINYKTEELESQIASARRDVSRINGEIVRLEEKSAANFIVQLEAKLKQKLQELKAHAENKPAKVDQPDSISDEQKAAFDAIAGKLTTERGALNDISMKISASAALQKALSEKVASIHKIEGKIDNFEAEYVRLKGEIDPDLQKLGLDFASIVNLAVDKGVLIQLQAALTEQKTAVDRDLSLEVETSLVRQRQDCLERITTLQDQLDAPNKLYQQYVESVRLWEEKAKEIEGAPEIADSLKWYEAQLSYIRTELPGELEKLKEQRREMARRIHDRIAAIRDVYKELFSSVQELISGSVIIKEGFKLTFESSIIDRTFQFELFDRYLSQGNAGSFYGKDKGAAVLGELRADFDFNDADSAIEFVEKILEYLQFDMRNASKPSTDVSAQLRKNVSVKDLYDFLWTFGYVRPEYSLKLDGKDLNLLSPGERGTLLLVFYLLVDKSNKPIVVDQPEENLDSQTVYRLLIPVIKDVKQRRQIIMVTHSPNIAVVCDAEQIIHCVIDRSSGNQVHYTLGSIEAPEINRYLVDVLEGTRPAFDNRDAKYYVR